MEENYPIYKLELPKCIELVCVPPDECIEIIEEKDN